VSKLIATDALNRMNLREVMLSSTYGGLINDMQQLAVADEALELIAYEKRAGELCSMYGFGSPVSADKVFIYADGVAIIPVHGTLINRFAGSYGYVTGYAYVRAMQNAAKDDPDVQLIVYDHNSYGGEAAGCFELTDEIAAIEKPTLAVVDSASASAAYSLASACDKIVVTPSASVGSIGVKAQHMDISEALKMAGVKITVIAEGEHKDDGSPFAPLPAAVIADVRKSVVKRYGAFCDLVARNRGLDSQAVRDTESRSFDADEALALKLIDAVASPAEAVSEFLAELGSDEPIEQDDEEMSTTPAAVAAAAPAAVAATGPTVEQAAEAARTSEQARISGILTCAEAEGRTGLANHLAFKTGMSVDDAKVMLAASEKAAPAAAAAVATVPAVAPAEGAAGTAADAAHGAAFSAAMASTANPGVTAETPTGAGVAADQDTPQARSARILAAQAKGTGVKVGAEAKPH
jgi:signal peptide peptidase SppA